VEAVQLKWQTKLLTQKSTKKESSNAKESSGIHCQITETVTSVVICGYYGTGFKFHFHKETKKKSVILLHSYEFTRQQYPKVITNRSNSMCSSILRVKNNK